MRGVLMIAMLAGCYGAHAATGAPCGAGEPCPSVQVCGMIRTEVS